MTFPGYFNCRHITLYLIYYSGNDIIHQITSSGNHKLRVNMDDFDGNHRYAEYDSFSVSDERNGYRLHVNGYTGNVGGK